MKLESIANSHMCVQWSTSLIKNSLVIIWTLKEIFSFDKDVDFTAIRKSSDVHEAAFKFVKTDDICYYEIIKRKYII